jgi:hypothetical protein
VPIYILYASNWVKKFFKLNRVWIKADSRNNFRKPEVVYIELEGGLEEEVIPEETIERTGTNIS